MNITERRQAASNDLLTIKQIHNNFADLVSSKYHSNDFVQTRNAFINDRLRFMCLLFAIAVPVSTVFDFLLFEQAVATHLLPLRFALSGCLFLIYWLASKNCKSLFTKMLLCCSFLMPSLFFIGIEHQFVQTNTSLPLTITMMPYLIVSMLGLFPLTLRAGLGLLFVISTPVASYHWLFLNKETVTLAHQLWLISLFGGIAIWLQLGQLSMLMKMYRESTIDPLTGLINRRVLMRQINTLTSRCIGTPNTFSVMILDLDRFKRINDNYGHQMGDTVLKYVSNTLKQQVRRNDIAARFGGEEFVVVLPNTSLAHAKPIAKRIADAIPNHLLVCNEGEEFSVTTSIGLTEFNDNDDAESLLKRADELLYQAKSAGRNTIKSE
ncbi:GGDEF domain-containing protein [Psychrobium sp. 1_MG-2023]|uniref:GGDEF domain-containing protein n=1 Tax=Psychrobium sp. 1_MG-2023 TaxID=3062624 RepID=UPI000C327D6B|nr:GGDEF domain-containing protein [Psychrobium sp. 1_MG-2023]MDP2561731.1 GGDEF domain-containing protein [Psychrobium sp. 1_MG-2023]PKF59780.1 GGDEF domain-containing protein [Alteromonadales bacterium alter-6D02]